MAYTLDKVSEADKDNGLYNITATDTVNLITITVLINKNMTKAEKVKSVKDAIKDTMDKKAREDVVTTSIGTIT